MQRTPVILLAWGLLLGSGVRALLLSSVLLFCSLVFAPPPVQASTMDDIARFFGFGSDSDGSSVRNTTTAAVHVGSADTSDVSTTAGGDVTVSGGAPVTHAAAPEIDAGALTSAVALAAGGLLAFGVRRRRVRR